MNKIQESLLIIYNSTNEGMSESEYTAKDKLSNFVSSGWSWCENKTEYTGELNRHGIPVEFAEEVFDTLDLEANSMKWVAEEFGLA